MEKFKKIFGKVVNKYTITLLIFIIFMFVGKKHNAVQRIEYKREINSLKEEIAKYKAKIAKDSARLEQLRSNSSDLEEFVREEYKWHSPDEDVYTVETNK